MGKIDYSIVDVFSQGKYTGNQLAVFKNAENISSREMQQIAKEINYSETTFILSDTKKDNGYDVRIFTPNEEVPFAGHPTLGTAYIIQNEIVGEPIEKLVLNFKTGQIPVTFDQQEEILWMEQNQPTFGRMLNSNQVSEVLSLDKEYIDDRFPIQEVSTGLPVIIVPLKSLEAVKNVRINKEKYFELIEHTDAKAIMVFSPETYSDNNHLNVRDFADYFGIPEDAATGSANGCLASYLVKYRYFDKGEINIRVEQGYEISRPSLLFLRANDENGEIRVSVGGKVEKIAQGEWFL
ncbi:PhzF family phenazine biosynthesis protein [Mesobacillus maritimus]|uniref:PhzF family phenazine biosynthesis protein n=1 Tax=Mesobacillus maritimus TaxID=1643336 RepID=UPI00203BFA96|nr:PhzF family phenazine biosynthesis protein [Mesobacillus maritimus]MCM3672046.1 PhzF family phenazine biosynthesis protein [Mesobacillus maritimus]